MKESTHRADRVQRTDPGARHHPGAGPDRSRRGRRRGILAAKGVLAFGLLALAVWSNRDQIREVAGRPHDPRLFAAAFALYLAGAIVAMLRWYGLVRAAGLPFRVRDGFRLGFIALLFNFVIPGAIGGDFVKAAYLCREQGKKLEPIASVVIDRLLGVLGLFLLAAVGGSIGWSRLAPPVRQLVTAAWIAAGVAALILVLAFLPPLRRRSSGRMSRLDAVGAAYRRRLWVVPVGVGLGITTVLLQVLAFSLIDRALFADSPTVIEHVLIVPLVLFTTAVPLPFGALGVAEGASQGMFGLAGSAAGAVAMMVFRLLQLGGALIGVAIYLANASQVRAWTSSAEQLEAGLLAEPEPVVAEA